MRRRELLEGLGAAGAAGLAGCLGFELQQPSLAPPLVADRPDAVYVPTHVEGMHVADVANDGAYRCALTYSYPHRFWLVTGDRRNKVQIKQEDSIHLMPIVWHRETGIVPPDLSPQVRIRRDGEAVTSLAPWPMLSQPMGFHFGDNVTLPAEATYQVEVTVGEGAADRTGSLAAAGPATFSLSMPYSRKTTDQIDYRDIPTEREGARDAVPPMKMDGLPSTQLPDPEGLPGTVRGTASTGDGRFVVTTLADATRFGGGEGHTYLAVSARTPYNRHPLPLMSVSATLTRGGETVYDDVLRATIDPDLASHYGAVVSDVRSGDDLTLTVDAPPQTARHEGYETAFLEMPPVPLTLD